MPSATARMASRVLDCLGLFQLGDDPGFAAVGRHTVAHQANILGSAHKRDGNGVHAVLEREFQVIGVLFRQRGNAYRNAGQVDALVLAQQAAVDDLADHVSLVHFGNAQLDQAVGEQNARALLDVLRQRLEGGAHQRGRARNLARRNGQPPPGLQQHRLVVLQQGGADFGPLQVAQDAQRLAFLAAYLADHLNQRQFFLVDAVGKVQADHIDARADQIPDDRLGVRGWAERGDNFCAALRNGIGQTQWCKRHKGNTPGKTWWAGRPDWREWLHSTHGMKPHRALFIMRAARHDGQCNRSQTRAVRAESS
jgi:hypothetical protein